MSSRATVRMSETEVADFLAGERKVQVATVGSDGAPHLTTLFYVVIDGAVAFWTYGTSQKIRNLRRDPRITCLVEAGEAYDELRGVSLTGTARLVEDTSEIERIGTAVACRMLGIGDLAELGEEAAALGAEQVARQARKRVAVLVDAERVASWDHRKMSAAASAPKEE